jgi:hypothetical protein
MTGELYHSGGVPMHAIRLTVTGVGLEELNALLAEFPGLSGDDSRLTFEVDGTGLSATLRSCLSERQTQGIIAALYEARRQREAAAT